MIRKVLQSTDSRLRLKSKPVGKIDKKILSIAQDLKDTLAVQKEPEGVGLAAPQIGKNLRLFLVSYNGVDRVVINPQILATSDRQSLPLRGKKRTQKNKKGEIMEGCLSLPNFYGPLKRAGFVKIKYLDENGKEKIEEFRDFFAQIVLHEIDHLDGILFVDRLLSAKSPLFRLRGKEWEEVELI